MARGDYSVVIPITIRNNTAAGAGAVSTSVDRMLRDQMSAIEKANRAQQRIEQQTHRESVRILSEKDRAVQRSIREQERNEQKAARASEQLQSQRSRALLSLWKAEEREYARAQKANTRAAEQAAKAQQQAAERAARASTKAHDDFAQRFTISYSAMKTAALATFAAIGTVGAGLGLAISKAMSFDVLERSLEVVAGNATEAQKQLVKLKELARLPGLGLRQAIEASIALQIGFQSAIKDTGKRLELTESVIEQFSNAIALTGGGPEVFQRVITQLTQMSNAGKVLMTDLRPIIQAAPAIGQALQKAFGTISPEEINALGLSTEQFMRKLVTALSEQPRAADSAANAWTNFTVAFDMALVKLGKPFLEPLTRALNTLEPLLDSLGTRVAEIFTMVGEDAAKLWASLPEPTRAAFADMLNTVQGLGGQIVQWFKNTYPEVLKAVTNVLNQIASFWGTHSLEIKQIAKGTLDSVLHTVDTGLKILQGDWEGAWNKIIAATRANKDRLVATATFLLHVLVEAVKNNIPVIVNVLIGLGKALGTALMDGVSSGINAKREELKTTMKLWALGLISSTKQALGVHSPSVVFHEIGVNIGQGLILGLQSTSEAVQQTLADLLDVTAGKFTKAPKKPAEAAAKQIAKILREQAEALREIGGKESAVDRMNRLLSDPSITKRIDERTKAILRMSAAIEDAQGATRERSAALTRPRVVNELDWLRLGSIRDREVEKGDPNNEMIRPRTVGDPVAIQMGQAYADVINDLNEKLERHTDLTQVEITLQRLQKAGLGDLTDARSQESLAIASAIDQQEALNDSRERIAEWSDDVGDIFGRAVDSWDGTLGGFFKSIKSGFFDMIKRGIGDLASALVSKGTQNILSRILGVAAPQPSGGGILSSLTGGFSGGSGGTGILSGGSTTGTTWGNFSLPSINAAAGPGASGGGFLNKILGSLGLGGGGGLGSAGGASGLAGMAASAGPIALAMIATQTLISAFKGDLSNFEALSGGGLLAFFINRTMKRKKEEKVRNTAGMDTRTAIYALLTEAQTGDVTVSQAKQRFEEIHQQYLQQISGITDSKTKRNALLWWDHIAGTAVDPGGATTALWPLIEAAAKESEKRGNIRGRMVPVFAGGGTSHMDQLIRVQPGEGVRYPGTNVVHTVFGQNKGYDSEYMFAPKGTRILNQSEMKTAEPHAYGGYVGGSAPSGGAEFSVGKVEVFIDADMMATVVFSDPRFKKAVTHTVKIAKREKRIA